MRAGIRLWVLVMEPSVARLQLARDRTQTAEPGLRHTEIWKRLAADKGSPVHAPQRDSKYAEHPICVASTALMDAEAP